MNDFAERSCSVGTMKKRYGGNLLLATTIEGYFRGFAQTTDRWRL